MKLYTIGYGHWSPAKRMDGLLEALTTAGVKLLIDTRHSPCASQLDPANSYGPRDWHVQAGDAGIEAALRQHGIEYRWLVELGNPQKTDPDMRILKEHLASADDRWPVNRGLGLLAEILGNAGPCALLCACDDWKRCHRAVIAEAMHVRFPGLNLDIVHLPSAEPS